MNPGDLPPDLFSPWEGAVAFRLFADQTDPTLTVSCLLYTSPSPRD